MLRSVIATLLLGASLAACVGPTEYVPPQEQLPLRDLTLDPELVTPAGVVYACGRWTPSQTPTAGWVLVDVHFGRRADTDPLDRPRDADVALVGRFGGRVVHRFHAPVVRAWMETARIPDLAAAGHFVAVLDVPDPARYDVPVIASYRGPVTDADVRAFERLGGLVTRRFDVSPLVAGWIPDHSMPGLRREAAVDFVELNSIGCVGGGVS